jgi:hypothetical protein
MAAEKIELLVTVKAYPAISLKYGEVVCVAGIRTDAGRSEWVRLYPIPFRDMAFAQRFKKYEYVTLKAERHGTDTRPESMRPNNDSLAVGDKLGTDKGTWAKRRALVEPLIVDSMCWLQRQQAVDGTSLGAFRPADVGDVEITSEPAEWEPEKSAIVNQASLLYPQKQALEKIPYRFRYAYRCSDPACSGHRQSIIDWEIHQAYRDWRTDYGEASALDRIRDKWLNTICADDRDTIFFVGTMHQHPDQFLVLGTFWPKS